MARQKRNSNQRKKRNPKQVLASQVKKEPDYAARRLIGKFGTQTMDYLGHVQLQLIGITQDFHAAAEKLGCPDTQAKADHYVLNLQHSMLMPNNTDINASCMAVWDELSVGRIGTYKKVKDAET